MSITPIGLPTDTNPSSNTATRITQPQLLTILRALWFLVLVFELVVVAYVLPRFISGQVYPPDSIAAWEEEGIAPIYYVAATLLAVITGGIALFLASVLMWRSRNERTAVVFSFVFLTLISFQLVEPPDMQTLPLFLTQLKNFSGIAAVMTFFYLFPDGRFIPIWTRYPFVLVILVLFINHLQYEAWEGHTGKVVIAAWVIGVGSFLYRYWQAKPALRQQVKWLLPPLTIFPIVGVVALLSSFLALSPSVSAFAGSVLALFFSASISAILLAIGLAVLRFNLWEVDLVINRSLVYGALTVLLGLLFAGIIALVSAATQGQGAGIGAIMAAVAATALFNPARKQAQRFVDRRIYGLRFDLNELNAAQKSAEIKNPGALSGRKLGAYDVLDVIGKGGMGEVYKGQGNGQIVALKILPDDLATQEEFRKRFAREVETLHSLSHPHIVKLYDSGISDNISYLAMEYIEGIELGDRLKSDKVLSLDDTRDILKGLASALDYAHGQGLVHRDIKPSNVMLRKSKDSETWEAVLMDFGVAKIHDPRTGITGTGAIGTIDYMAPEQIVAAKEVDKRADVYALGVMLYEMLTGEKPFKGSPAQVMFAHIQQPPPDPRDVQAEIPREIAKAVQQAMEKKPEDRFQSAGEFAAALA